VPDSIQNKSDRLTQDLPDHPGVYQMIDRYGEIIYVGKAKNIKKRVSQYFLPNRDFKTHILVSHIHRIEPIITKSEHDALLLENRLIKQYQPRFNVLLKDDKTYPYIKITLQEPFPKIIITRHKKNDGAKYFGPYTSIGSIRKLQSLLNDLFPIRDCKQAIDIEKPQKKCIQLDLGKCIGPCIYKTIKPEYDDYIQQCVLLLNGKSREIIDSLTKSMQKHSLNKEYEEAAVIRNKIQQLEQLHSQRHVDLESNDDHFIVGFSANDQFYYVACQHFSKKLFISQHGHYALKTVTFQRFITAFFEELADQLPKIATVVVDSETYPLAQPFLHDQIQLISPQKGRFAELLRMAQLNAQKSLIGLSKQSISPGSALDTLTTDLGLNVRPSIIFGCDISHYYGTNIVSSVVVFVNGKPDKKLYRHFNITTVTSGKSDDVKAMKETVSRLIDHYRTPPDLILIDGGKGQLNAALQTLRLKGMLHIQCISLAKRNEWIHTPYKSDPVRLPYYHAGLNLLRHVRDESHRFALNFQRSKRQFNQ
jgi:excinuclease ABC subunit C